MPGPTSGTAGNGDSDPSPGLASRIGSSAAQLGHDLVGGAPSSATSSLASAWASTQKAGPSSAAASGGGAGAALVGQGLVSSARVAGAGQEGPWEFRSARVADAAADEELGDWSHTPDSALAPRSAPSEKGGGQTANDQWKRHYDTVWDRRSEADDLSYRRTPNGTHDRTGEPQEDGADVVSLLRNPAFSTTSGSLADSISISRETEQTTAADLFNDTDLHPTELALAQQMRASLAPADPPQPHRPPNISPPHARLTPRTAPSPYQLHPTTDLLHLPTPPLHPSDSTHQTFPSALQRREWYEAWLSEWSDVLAAYAEEVWAPEGWRAGDVQRAREVVGEVKGRVGWWEDGVAVGRLRVVLGHLGGRWEGEGKGRVRAGEEEQRFRCPDCGGWYGSEGHVVLHEKWVREGGTNSRVEMEFERQTKDVEGRWGREELDRDS